MAHETVRINQNLTVVFVSRELESGTRETVNRLRDLCRREIDQGHDVIIDFASTNICPSIVWGNIIVQAKKAATSGRQIAICCLRPTLDKSVRIIGMTKYVHVYPSRNDALEAMTGGTENAS
ncbi:STAS domain-containing protein [Desulfolithobacter sp.]